MRSRERASDMAAEFHQKQAPTEWTSKWFSLSLQCMYQQASERKIPILEECKSETLSECVEEERTTLASRSDGITTAVQMLALQHGVRSQRLFFASIVQNERQETLQKVFVIAKVHVAQTTPFSVCIAYMNIRTTGMVVLNEIQILIRGVLEKLMCVFLPCPHAYKSAFCRPKIAFQLYTIVLTMACLAQLVAAGRVGSMASHPFSLYGDVYAARTVALPARAASVEAARSWTAARMHSNTARQPSAAASRTRNKLSKSGSRASPHCANTTVPRCGSIAHGKWTSPFAVSSRRFKSTRTL